MGEKLVIIGSGMATAKLLECLADNKGLGRYAITVIGEEAQPSYNRILLSSVLCGEKTSADLPLLTGDWYQRNGVSLVTGDKVIAVRPGQRQLQTASGKTVAFDKLVFATGSRAHIPDIPGAVAEGVFGFRSLADLDAIGAYGSTGQKAVVIGGGLLGLEAAHGLNALGLEVSVVHRQHYPMNRQLDEEAGHLLQTLLEARGIEFALAAKPIKISTQNNRASAVVLSNGATLAADTVLFAAGIDPNKELASAAGIACERAIVADPFLRTSCANIFALGECCQINGQTFGLVAPVWQQAEVLANVLAGEPCAGYEYAEAPTQLKVSGIDLYSAGSLPFAETSQSQILRDPIRGIYRRLVFSGNQLTGAILLGDRTSGSWYGELIESGADISQQKAEMMFGREFSRIV